MLYKVKMLWCVLLVTLSTLVYLPYMAHQSSQLKRRSAHGNPDDSQSAQSSRDTRLKFVPFRRRLHGPIHRRKVTHKSKVHAMYRDTMVKLLHDSKTFRDYFHKSHNIFPWSMRKSEKSKRKSKYLIYRCDKYNPCGSLVSKIRGIMTSFLIASLTNRTLKVDIRDYPCTLTNVLVPNLVNWTLPKSFHNTIPPDATPNIHVLKVTPNNSSFLRESTTMMDIPHLFPSKPTFLYVTLSRHALSNIGDYVVRHHLLGWMKELNKTEITSSVLRFLFKPSPAITEQMALFSSSSSSSTLTSKTKLACALSNTNTNSISYKVITSFITSYANRPNYKVFLSPNSGRDKLSREMNIPKDKFFFFQTDTFVRDLTLTKTVAVSNVGKMSSCISNVEDVLSYTILTHCDVLLVSNSAIVHLAAVGRGVSRGAVCVSKDGKSLSFKQCV